MVDEMREDWIMVPILNYNRANLACPDPNNDYPRGEEKECKNRD